MRAIKPNNYTIEDFQVTIIGEAICHPARKRIVQLLKSNKNLTNTKLSKILNLSKPAITGHLLKLSEANIVDYKYTTHEFKIKLNTNGFNKMEQFIHEIKS
ncbi:winged helix-turn-helix domain-containing protein [Fluviicola taffensis]|uniref:Regulatory protein ArsR n=1 Tax=Fluviicola taffensis (strain DSM 16823 / NCIMB 13979 / RW262) TaxID=755732 RepID=F2IG25_FLUTR|nr:winged helix-turn-helix domain-containing protein [Fluviicola taffensis]AEA44660.1 regulatory protein ArsR [Fluviicola taffensis DSM 16823]